MDAETPIVVGDTVKVIPGYFMPGYRGQRKVMVVHDCWLIVEGRDRGYVPARKFRKVKREPQAATP